MLSDAHFALRQLRKSPGFTLLAMLTLALGIGLNTAIFSLVNDLFLRGLPFQDPGRLVHLYTGSKERKLSDFPLSAPRFQHFRDGQTIYSAFAAESGTAVTLTGQGEPLQMPAFKVTANYFDVLGVRPLRGRNFLPQEEEGADVALVSEQFWRRQLASDPNVIGRSLMLDGTAHTIVGVLPKLPASWTGPNVDLWMTKPFVIPGFSHERMMRGTAFLRVVGRVKPDLTIEQASAALAGLDRGYREKNPGKIDAGMTTTAVPLPVDVNAGIRPAFATLFAAVSFVLLIACSNVANLLLVRFSGRRREIALRMALGASRANVLRLFVFESVLLSLAAAGVGALLAYVLVPLVPRITANFLPLDPGAGIGLSAPVLGFTIVLALVTALAMGIFPALQSSRTDLVDGLKEGARGSSGGAKQQRFRKVLVGAQVALSVTLLAGAALLISSFVRLSQQSLGFRPEKVWAGFITLPVAAYPDPAARARFADRTLAAMRAVPGFESVSFGDAPLTGGNGATLYARPDGAIPPVAEREGCPSHNVSPDFFKTLGIPLLAGRGFTEHDLAERQNVILISQSGAKKVFGHENPIGRTLLITSGSVPVEIVGVVGDVRSVRIAQSNEMEFYRPWAQDSFPFATLLVRSSLPPDAVTRAAQGALAKVDPALAIAQPAALDTVVSQALGEARLMMWLLGVFAGVALLLATVGIYGAVAYSVGQRTSEIGVRMALGAQTTDVLRLIVSQGMRPVFYGLGVGLAASLGLGQLIRAQLFETSAYNPVLLIGTLLTLALAALLACLVPAWRASLVRPIEALRAE